MISIVIPMAGLGTRFIKAGYNTPKPFIDILGKPMIVRVLDNLFYNDAKFILIAREEHLDKEKELVEIIKRNYNVVFIPIDKVTEGAACTVMFAREFINNDDPVVIANSDQIVDINFIEYVNNCLERGLDGSIMTFRDPHKDPKWSFVLLNRENVVTKVKEKEPISNIATVGIYMFSKGRDYVDAAVDMIINNDRVNNEFYVCPVYNYAVKKRKRIGIFNIDFNKMHGIGTPEDLGKYEERVKNCTQLSH